MKNLKSNENGFTIFEIILSCIMFPMLVISISGAYDAIRRSYTISKQYNEMYAVLSACPEIDRALQYDSISSNTNCYPNNSFKAEGESSNIITYQPTLTVTNTSALPNSDPLRIIPDSKIVNISTGFQKSTAPPLELRMLITRNGIGQL